MHYPLQNHTFELNPAQTEAALAAKRVIGGQDTGCFDLFPVKYAWALEKYGIMVANHWEPDDIPMQKDVEQWQSDAVSASERWIIQMGIGYFSAAEGIVGDNIQHVVRDLVTAPELRMVLGRHAHEENIHADSLLYMISSLGINPHECEAMFEQIPTIVRKNEFVTRHSRGLRRGLDLSRLENQRLLAKNLFVFGQCMEGTQFYGLFAMILSLKRQGKFAGIGEMFEYTLRDETNHIEVFRRLFLDLLAENPAIASAAFQAELLDAMREAVAMEKDFIRDCLPAGAVGLRREDAESYIDFIADKRLRGCGLPPLHPGLQDPLPWLDESIRQIKEKNFFETRVTSYQKVASFFSDLFRPQPEEALAGPDPRDLWAEARTTPVDAELPVAGEPGPSAGRAMAAAPTALAARLATPAPATGRETDYTIGTRVFRLDRGKAEAAYAAKRVIHGRESLTFNLLPLRYEWAYHLYKQMKQAHWGPLSPDISLEQDVRAWRAGALSEQEKQAVALCLGWLVSLPRLPGAGLQHLLRLHVTAPELKLVLGREPQDLNTRLETAVFLAQALGLNLHDCEAQFRQTVELDSREAWVRPHVEALTHCQDLSSPEATADFARAVYLAGPCLKGLAFASLHLLLQDWTTEGKCPGLSRLLSKILADEAHCLKVFQHLLEEAAAENPDLNQLSFGEALIHLLDECLAREKALLDRLLPPSTGDAARRLRLAGELDQLAQRLKIQPGKILSGRTILTLCSDDDF